MNICNQQSDKKAAGEFELVVRVDQNTFEYCNLIFVDHGQLIIGESPLIFLSSIF